jgi:hypothetical protein
MRIIKYVQSKLNATQDRTEFTFIIYPDNKLSDDENKNYWDACPVLDDGRTHATLFKDFVAEAIPFLSEINTENLGSALQVCLSFDHNCSILAVNMIIETFQVILKRDIFV